MLSFPANPSAHQYQIGKAYCLGYLGKKKQTHKKYIYELYQRF